ncbi:MAG: dihydroneopterin aldolase [Planctomycetes bacterium]|nr:dihydroneopterin aldolase [Planctomycetota bacterium]
MADDRVLLEGLEIESIIGTDPREREAPQPILADVTLWTDVARPGASDRIADALNYRALAEGLRSEAMAVSPLLLERLALHLGKWILERFPADRVMLTLRKPRALPYAQAAGVSITLSRRQEPATASTPAPVSPRAR